MSFTQSKTFSQVARRKPQGKNANQSQFCPFRAASCRSTVTQRFHRGSTDQNTNQSQFQASIQSPYNTNSKPNPISRSGGAGAPPHRHAKRRIQNQTHFRAALQSHRQKCKTKPNSPRASDVPLETRLAQNSKPNPISAPNPRRRPTDATRLVSPEPLRQAIRLPTRAQNPLVETQKLSRH